MAIKVIQWATGHTGMRSLDAVLRDPGLELVGLYVYNPEKLGRDAGDLLGRAATGVIATDKIEDILALEADVVIYMPEVKYPMDEHDDNVRRLLRSGKNVIALPGYYWPWTHGDDYAETFEEAGQAGNATLFGTGFSPGYMTERLAVGMTEICSHVDHIRYVETCDCSRTSAMKVTETMGFGKLPNEISLDDHSSLMTSYYHYEVLDAVAYHLGVKLTRKETEIDTALAERDVELSPSGVTIRKGTVGATSRRWIGYVEDHPFIICESRWMVVDHIKGFEPDQRWEVTVEGRPAVHVELRLAKTFEGDTDWDLSVSPVNEAIGSPSYNAIARVCAAPAGILRAEPFGAWRKPAV